MKQMTITIIILVIAWQSGRVQIAVVWDAQRLRLVDASNCTATNQKLSPDCIAASHAFLVRGNVPTRGHQDIQKVLDHAQQAWGFRSTPKNLVLFTLLDPRLADESAVLRDELKLELSSSTKVMSVPIRVPWAAALPVTFRGPGSVLSWITGGAWEAAEQLRELLLKNHDKPTIIYLHCMRGIDRTGLVAGTYTMRYQNDTLSDVLALNEQVGQRRMQWLEERGLHWSAHHVRRTNHSKCPYRPKDDEI